ncbi:MAG: ABC transporter permease [Terriglobales bacterium]|jgi:predicted permease
MDAIIRFFKKLSILFTRERFHRELEEEMAFHREQQEKTLRDEGIPPEEAKYAAMRQFGNAARLKEKSLDTVGFRFESAVQDFRYALRQLRKNPGFACTAIFVLALGMGVTVAIFGFVDAALLKPLPYRAPSRLVNVTERIALIPRARLSYLDYLDWKKLNTVFSSMDVFTEDGFALGTPTGSELVAGTRVSDGFFRTLGVAPMLGRDFYAGEDLPAAVPVVMLSYATWQKRFGGRQDVIGQTVTLSDAANTIIGVLPQNFHFAPTGQAEFWTTLRASGSCEKRRSCHNLDGIGRLKDGVSVQAALANATTMARQLELQYPDTNQGQGASVMLLSEMIVGDVRPILLVLLGGAGLLLLIACLNVASLLLVRSESRKREIAVRGALGASRGRLVLQFVTEGLVLMAGGTVLGLAFAVWAMQLLARLIPAGMLADMPYLHGLGLNLHVLAFTGAIALLAAGLFSITPTLRLVMTEMREGLAEGGRGSAGTLWRRFGANLVVVELAVAVVLLAGAGLLGKSFYRLLHVDLGFQPDHLATLQIAAPDSSYSNDERAVALARRVVNLISSLPGVKSAALASVLPVSFNGNTTWIRFPDRPYHGEHNEVNERDVSSKYFTTLKARLLRGRYFTDAEDASKPGVVIINQALARQYFPGQDPIGKKIVHYDLDPKTIREIIGIVDDIKEGPLDSEIWPAVYYPLNQAPNPYFTLVVRTSQDEQSMLPTLVSTIHQIDPRMGTSDEATLNQRINESQTAYLHRSSALLVGGFASLALLLGVVGLYGVIAYSVGQRTREIGVRMALGAQRGSVYRLILTEAGRLTAGGIAIGLVCSVAASRLMGKLLFGVRSWDALTLAAVAVVLAASALLASYIPAHRAASVNPLEALRAE